MRLAPLRNKVVFLSRQADEPSRDFRMLAAELKRRHPELEVVVRCRFVPGALSGRAAYLGEVLAQMRELATARVCVVDGYIVPVSVLAHRSELTVIQMWHALGAIKYFGYQSVGRSSGRPEKVARAMRMHRNYDVVVCGGPGAVPAFAQAFDVVRDSVMPLGLPRVDYLLAQSAQDAAVPPAIAELKRRNPRLSDAGRMRVLYAPTYRRHQATAFRQVVEAFAGERFTLIVKPHDLEDAPVDGEHVVDASGVDVCDLIGLADAVVTDYSAVAFEAAVLEKPLYFWVYDIEEYSHAQGLNLDPRADFPDSTFTDVERLVEALAGGGYTVEALCAFRERYLSLPPQGCTAAIADLVDDRLDR